MQLIGQISYRVDWIQGEEKQTPHMGDKTDMLMEESGNNSSHLGKLPWKAEGTGINI